MMYSKNYHSKVETDELDNLRLDEHMLTLQKESKYYSNNDDTAIKKKLIDHYDQDPSTQHSNFDNTSASLLNQLHDAIHSYRPSFKEVLPQRKLNYLSTSFETEKPGIKTIHEEEPSQYSEKQEQAPLQRYQMFEPVRKARISRVDREISALYKENRNINLEYRKQKFMQLFLKPDEYYKH